MACFCCHRSDTNSGIDYYKAKPNRTVIIISWISYDKMSDNSFIFIHSRERIEAS